MSEEVRPQLVTIGIPTFNRVHDLRRAVESALGQDYSAIEIVISDNASTDGTGTFCSELAATNERVRYVRLERNLGALGNFDATLRCARGAYFMWLGDDDWIDPDYVSDCVAALDADASFQLVAGNARYYAGGELVLTGEVLNLLQPDPWDRVVEYYRRVRLNGVIYGVARTSVLAELLPLRHSFGRDWLMSAALASRGGIQTLTTTQLHRTVGGMSSNPDLVGQVGLGTMGARFPYGSMFANVCTDVVVNPMFDGIRWRRRIPLALICGLIFSRTALRTKLGAYRQFIRRHAHSVRNRLYNRS